MTIRNQIVEVLSRHGLRWANGDIVDNVTINEHTLVDDLLKASTFSQQDSWEDGWPIEIFIERPVADEPGQLEVPDTVDLDATNWRRYLLSDRPTVEQPVTVEMVDAAKTAWLAAPPGDECLPAALRAALAIAPNPRLARLRVALERIKGTDLVDIAHEIADDALCDVDPAPTGTAWSGAARAIHDRLLQLDGLDPLSKYTELLRVAKLVEEAGEAMQALIAYHGVNPRKPRGPLDDLVVELADVALAAKVAIEAFGRDSTAELAQRERAVLDRLQQAPARRDRAAERAQLAGPIDGPTVTKPEADR